MGPEFTRANTSGYSRLQHLVQRSPVLLYVILLGGWALRLYRLGVSSLWYDETVSLYLARQDLVSLTRHTAGDIHPPLYYYLLHFWGLVAGWSEFSAAFVSVFFGILLIALVYRMGRTWFDARVGVIAAFLIGLSPYNLWYSQEVRMYTLGALLGLASVYFFLRVITRPAPARVSTDLVFYAVVSALGLYTLYYFAFLLVFENLAALVRLVRPFPRTLLDVRANIARHKAEVTGWILSQLAVLLLYVPWVTIAFRQATDPPVPPWRSYTPLGDALVESFSALAVGQSADPNQMAPVLVLAAAILGFALVRKGNGGTERKAPVSLRRVPRLSRDDILKAKPSGAIPNVDAVAVLGIASGKYSPRNDTGTRLAMTPARVSPLFLLAYTFVPFLLIWGLSLWKPLYHVRYIFTYSPGFYLLLALGLSGIYRARAKFKRTSLARSAVYAALGVLAAASLYSAYNFWYNPAYADDDLRGAVQRIAARWRPGDAILIDAGYTFTAFAYYNTLPVGWQGRLTHYTGAAPISDAVVLQVGSIGGSPTLGWGSPESDFYATTEEETRAALDRVFAAHERVWLLRLYDTVVDPRGVLREYLASNGKIFDDEGVTGNAYARVQGYLTPRARLGGLVPEATARPVDLGQRITLLGFKPKDLTAHAGDRLYLDLYWQTIQPTNIDDYTFIGVYAVDGRMVTSESEMPLGNAWGTSRWTPGEILHEPVRVDLPADLGPGEYSVRVALYNPLTNEPLVAAKSEWVDEAGQVEVTRVKIPK